MDISWMFVVQNAAGVRHTINPTMTGSVSQDLGREIRRSLSGLTFLPTEFAKFTDLANDAVYVTLNIDDVPFPIGIFYAVESNYQPDVVLDSSTGEVSDLYHIDFGCGFTRLRRSDEKTRLALRGSDPTQLMVTYANEAGLDNAIAGSFTSFQETTVWGAGTDFEQIISQLAEVAGHRSPWCDNNGVLRSVAALVVDAAIINLEVLGPMANTIVITEQYLSAPNRVVVEDTSAGFPVIGIWEAPATAPHSLFRRGYPLTVIVGQQGLGSAVNAQRVAETIGESLSSRRLSCEILPTTRLDGPVILRYRDSLWLCQNWSLDTGNGALMSIEATELIV